MRSSQFSLLVFPKSLHHEKTKYFLILKAYLLEKKKKRTLHNFISFMPTAEETKLSTRASSHVKKKFRKNLWNQDSQHRSYICICNVCQFHYTECTGTKRSKTTRSARFARPFFFSRTPISPFFPTVEPGPRLLIGTLFMDHSVSTRENEGIVHHVWPSSYENWFKCILGSVLSPV